MSVFIELTTEPFEDNMRRYSEGNKPGDRAGISSARRPLRGIEVKEDTHAIIQVIRSDGTSLPLVDQGSPDGESFVTASFLIQSAQEARMEKHQIIETFGEPYIYFFGESPRFLDVQAILINSFDFNWEAEWWHNWETRFRGTKTVEQGARTYLFYDDTIVEGYMLMANAIKSSDQPWTVQLTWRMFITNYRNISFVGDPNFPVHASINLPPNVNLSGADAFDQLITQYASESREREAQMILDDEIRRAADQPFGSARRLSDALRLGVRSIAFAPDVARQIAALSESNPADAQALDVFNTLTNRAIRGKFVENVDEWTNGPDDLKHIPEDGLPPVYQPRWRSIQESQDLFFDAIRWMMCFGAEVNDHSSVRGLGLRVNFGLDSNGLSLNVGSSNNLRATFSPVANVNSGRTVSAGSSVGADADLFFSAGAGVSGGLTSLDGAGGFDYGYSSPFGGAGVGAVGFGDQEGFGYGSSFGDTGDPGYIDPGRFTFAGVEDERDAFERFAMPKRPHGSGLGGGISVGASFSGSVGVGASVQVGGKISAFSLEVVPGTLNPNGDCDSPGPSGNGALFSFSGSVSLSDLI